MKLIYSEIFQPIKEETLCNMFPKPVNSISTFDLYCPIDAHVKPHALANIPSGFRIILPEGFIGLISPRRSKAIKYAMFFPAQIIHPNDANEIVLNFMHFGTEDLEIRKGDSIAQVTLIKALEYPLW